MFLVESIMTKDVVSVKPDSSLEIVTRKMASKKISSVIVMEKNKPIGIISERDFVKKVLALGKINKTLFAKDIMSSPLISVKPNDTIMKTAKLMREQNIRHFAVVRENMLMGIVSETDIVKGEGEYVKAHQILQNLVLTLFMTLILIFVLVFRLV